MKHFKTEDWVDFVNQVASGKKQDEMREHLESGCKRCAKTVELLQRVRKASAAEMSYQPPAETVRIVKAAYTTTHLGRKRKEGSGAIELLFDSFLQPLAAGARASGRHTRQMLYRADPYQIDVQIEAKPESRRLAVTGQLLDLSRPSIVGHDVGVVLSNRRGHAVHLVTNQFGEFSGEVEKGDDVELSIAEPGKKPIVICLRDVLRQLSGDPQ